MGVDFPDEMEKSMLSPQVQQEFDELVALLAGERYGPGGPRQQTRRLLRSNRPDAYPATKRTFAW